MGVRQEVTINDLAEKIRKSANSTSEIRFISYEDAYTKDFEDMQRRVPSIEKIKGLIGWKQKTSLNAILQEVIDYYRVNE